MQELIVLTLGLAVGGFVGFNVGIRRMVDKAEEAAQDFVDALRVTYGTLVQHDLVVGEAEDGTELVERIEVVELTPELEALGGKLFTLD